MKSRVYCSILVLAMLVSPGGCRRSSGNRQDEGFLQIKGSDTIVNAGQTDEHRNRSDVRRD